MATREENLKKINLELEKVAGGTCYEISDDSKFLNVLLHKTTKYHQCDRYGATRALFSGDVEKSWNSLGIKVKFDPSIGVPNKYFKDGKEISREKAWAHAESLVGKHLTEAQWNW